MKIVMAGGSGYLGRLAAKHFLATGHQVVTLSRGALLPAGPCERAVGWDVRTSGPWGEELAGADLLLNLAGRSVNCRYTHANREEILRSRVDSTLALGEAVRILPLERRPRLWLNFSTATIYAHAERPQTESAGEIGKGFSVEIARAWEEAFFSHQGLGTRLVALRSAMVFGPGPGGVYEAYRGIVSMGLGGKAGSGKQFVSWLHIADFLGMLDFLVAQREIEGPVNLSSPFPERNRDFMRVLRESLGESLALPAPEWLLELGALFRGTETELLLKSRCVVPERLLAAGYEMKFPRLRDALTDLAKEGQ